MANHTDPVEIPRSKDYIVIGVLALLVLLGADVWVFMHRAGVDSPLRVYTISIAGFLIFSAGIFLLVRKYKDESPGLIIADEGVTDNVSRINSRFVPWADVIEIKRAINIISLVVKKEYIKKEPSIFIRIKMLLGYYWFGKAEVWITTNALDCKTKDVMQILERKLEEVSSKAY